MIRAGKYADIPLGLHIVRGDNIVLLGEIDVVKETNDMRLTRISPEEISELTDVINEKIVWDFE